MTGNDIIDFADIDPTKMQTPSYADLWRHARRD
jgi:hypothetical protein